MTTDPTPPPQPPASACQLPLDDNGAPIPWITCWHPTFLGSMERALEPGTGDELVQVALCGCMPGTGQPELDTLCPDRQRQAVRERRCSFCGHQLHPDTPSIALTDQPHPDRLSDIGLHRDCAHYCLHHPTAEHEAPTHVLLLDPWDAQTARLVLVAQSLRRGHRVTSEPAETDAAVIYTFVVPTQVTSMTVDEWLALYTPDHSS